MLYVHCKPLFTQVWFTGHDGWCSSPPKTIHLALKPNMTWRERMIEKSNFQLIPRQELKPGGWLTNTCRVLCILTSKLFFTKLRNITFSPGVDQHLGLNQCFRVAPKCCKNVCDGKRRKNLFKRWKRWFWPANGFSNNLFAGRNTQQPGLSNYWHKYTFCQTLLKV